MSFLTGILQEAASIVEAEDELELLEEMVLLNEDESIGQTVLGVKIPLPQLESDERIVMMAEALFEEACKSRLIGEGDDFDEEYPDFDEDDYDEEEDELFESLYIRESSDDDITRGGEEDDLFSDDDSGLAAGAEEDVEEDIDEDEEVSVDDMEDLYDQYEDDDGSLISP
jgi:hypothetical protein